MRAEAAMAQQLTIKVEEEGKAAAAKSKWEQERIKIAEVTKAEQEYEVARLAALKATENAKRIKAEGEAEAAAARAKVAAGLDPYQKAIIEKETAIGVAKALAESQVRWVPEIIVNGQNSGSNNAMDAVGLNMLLDIVKKQSK